MEQGFSENLKGKAEGINECVESTKLEQRVERNLADDRGCKGDSLQVPRRTVDVEEEVPPTEGDTFALGDVNMEASIIAGDVIRAGGFGARDDISSFLPVASDSTDFEANLLDARDYEEPQQDIKRPGLGWTEAKS